MFTAALLAFALSPPVQHTPRLLWSILGAGTALLLWRALLLVSVHRRHRLLRCDVVLRPQHYVQACAHTSILLYWGWHWRPVYDAADLIVVQLLFAYAFDMLLTWSREDTYVLGVGPFPIVLSTNLFLWFRPEWFYLQFLMLAVGFAAKAFLRWDRDGRPTHIFNPSAFTLTVFSFGLLLTGTTWMTRGQDIAVTQFYPPHMHLFLFLVALPGQFLFGVTTMTMSAVVTTYLWGLAYHGMTGTYYFYDSYIPIAVFLGMHLLFTDPSTAPRSEGGRMIFGALYGLSTVALYEVLGVLGLPTFYDKLLQVPVLNLLVIQIDRAVRAPRLNRFNPSHVWRALTGRRRHLAYVSGWTVIFSLLRASQGVGDRHPGQWLPFWQQACHENRAGACRYLEHMHATYCRAGSLWSCRERDRLQSGQWQERRTAIDPPQLEELPILLRGSKGPITDRDADALVTRACAQGWVDRCRPDTRPVAR